jgi:hypothetical protein
MDTFAPEADVVRVAVCIVRCGRDMAVVRGRHADRGMDLASAVQVCCITVPFVVFQNMEMDAVLELTNYRRALSTILQSCK